MNVTREMVDKLKQNDRIEYLLKINTLNQSAPSLSTFYLWFLLIGSIICSATAFLILSGGNEEFFYIASAFAELGSIAITIFMFMLVLEIIFYIWSIIRYRKKVNSINSEFFELKERLRK